jgi:tRNA dimethylallyltransferase
MPNYYRYVANGMKINEIRERGRMPIVVGGTHYYVQSLLFPDSILADEDSIEEPVRSAEELSKAYPILYVKSMLFE